MDGGPSVLCSTLPRQTHSRWICHREMVLQSSHELFWEKKDKQLGGELVKTCSEDQLTSFFPFVTSFVLLIWGFPDPKTCKKAEQLGIKLRPQMDAGSTEAWLSRESHHFIISEFYYNPNCHCYYISLLLLLTLKCGGQLCNQLTYRGFPLSWISPILPF